MNTARVSILMAAYNEERFLPATLNSLLTQSFENFELLCVDDGSTDGTLTILENYARSDRRLKVIRNAKAQGLTASLNIALKQAQGEYIARADADDLYHPSRLALQVAYLDRTPEVVLLSTQRIDIDEDGKALPTRKNSPQTDLAMRWRMFFDSPCLHPVVMWRSSVQMSYNEKFRVAQDYDLWARMSQKGKMAALPQRLLFRRVHQSSVSVKRKEEQQANRDAVSLACLKNTFGVNIPNTQQIHRWRESFFRHASLPPRRRYYRLHQASGGILPPTPQR